MDVQEVVCILCVLSDASTVWGEELFGSMVEVPPDGVHTTSKKPRFEHVWHLYFLASSLRNLLASAGHRDRHGELTSFISSISLGRSGRGL